jgi:hypothetical protein
LSTGPELDPIMPTLNNSIQLVQWAGKFAAMKKKLWICLTLEDLAALLPTHNLAIKESHGFNWDALIMYLEEARPAVPEAILPLPICPMELPVQESSLGLV